MNSTQVQCFLRVAETHSFTKAAAALYLTQQSVSRQIAALEEDVGTRLLDRTTAYITLTPAGRQYYQLLAGASRDYAQLKANMEDSVRRLHLRLRVGISQWLNPASPLGEAIDRFRAAHPGTLVELVHLDNEALSSWLQEGKLDAAYFSEGQFPLDNALQSTPVADCDMRLYAPEDVLQNTDPEAVDCCWDLPMLMVPAWDWSFLERRLMGDQEQAEFGLHPRQVITLPNLRSLQAALRFQRCTTVGEARFGVFNHIPRLGSLPLPLEEHLLLAWPAGREHPLLADLQEISRQTLALPDKES